MKKLITLVLIFYFFSFCSVKDDDKTDIPSSENTPTRPTLVAPVNNNLCAERIISFEWAASTSPNNKTITYQIEVATDIAFTRIVKTATGSTTRKELTLEKNTTYYWRIKAIDSDQLASEYSSVYTLNTAGDAIANKLPFAPELIQPLLNETISTTTASLKWNATDPDTKDVLTYDVYFDTTNPPTKKTASNIQTVTYNITVKAKTAYFWKIVVKDNNGGETTGQIWKFKTN